MSYSLGVIIPVYNVEKYLDKCLGSLARQTVPFDEIILVNDGSYDESRSICEKYCLEYPGMRLIDQCNRGPSAARNKGIMCCGCDYIVFLDADDYIVPQMVETLKRRLNGQDMFCYAAEIQNNIKGIEYSNNYIRSSKVCKDTMTGMEFFQAMFPHNYIVSPCLAAYRRTFLSEYHICFPEGLYYEDEFFSVQLVCNARKVECIADKLYVRRYRPGSTMTGIINERKYTDKIQIQLKMWDYVKVRIDNGWERSLLLRFVLQNISKVLLMDRQYHSIGYSREFEKLYWKKFAEYWEEYYEIDSLSFVDCFILMKAYEKLIHIGDKSYLLKYAKIKQYFEVEQSRILKGLRLNDKNVKVGIYGMGKHSTAMLEWYEKKVGKVECQYIFIVSTISQKFVSTVNGHRIVLYDDIPEDINQVIISSLIFQNDMIENLKKTGISLKKIYTLYKEDAVCDLCTMLEIGSIF